MSSRKYGRYLAGVLVAGAIPLAIGAAFAADGPHRAAGPHGGMSPMFSQMDADKDGKITRAEIEAHHKARAAEIDADKDGKVTAAELRTWMDKQREKRLGERLAQLDRDGDGAVSVQEFEDGGVWRAARMDRNGDGVIDGGDRQRTGHGHHGQHDHGGHHGHR